MCFDDLKDKNQMRLLGPQNLSKNFRYMTEFEISKIYVNCENQVELNAIHQVLFPLWTGENTLI